MTFTIIDFAGVSVNMARPGSETLYWQLGQKSINKPTLPALLANFARVDFRRQTPDPGELLLWELPENGYRTTLAQCR